MPLRYFMWVNPADFQKQPGESMLQYMARNAENALPMKYGFSGEFAI